MKKIIAVFAISGLTACGGTTIPVSGSSGASGSGSAGGSAAVGGGNEVGDASFKTILNSLRLKTNNGQAVSYDSRLDAAAQAHSDDMVANSYFSHDSDRSDSDGTVTSEVGDRVKAQGYDWLTVGENIAGGGLIPSEQAALDSWENSPAHFNMMTTAGFEDFGLASAGKASDNTIRWTLVMATEKPKP